MAASLDPALSMELAQTVKSKAGSAFDNAYRAVLTLKEATYVQGFISLGAMILPIEHAWVEWGDRIIDPTLPHLEATAETIEYFAAQALSVKALKAAIEEAQEDYPEDDPLPIYGPPPYEYYGDLMLGGKDYLSAYQAAEARGRELG